MLGVISWGLLDWLLPAGINIGTMVLCLLKLLVTDLGFLVPCWTPCTVAGSSWLAKGSWPEGSPALGWMVAPTLMAPKIIAIAAHKATAMRLLVVRAVRLVWNFLRISSTYNHYA